MRNRKLVFNSAYAQLVLLVFLPIVMLSVVGAYFVEKESRKSIESEQRTLATAALIRYEPTVKQFLTILLSDENKSDLQSNFNSDVANRIHSGSSVDTNNEPSAQSERLSTAGSNTIFADDSSKDPNSVTDVKIEDHDHNSLNNLVNSDSSKANDDVRTMDSDDVADMVLTENLINTEGLDATSINESIDPRLDSLDDVQRRISYILSSMNNNQHIQNVAILNENGDILASSGNNKNMSWIDFNIDQVDEKQVFLSDISTQDGTAYGHLLDEYQGVKYWLFIDMDDEPLMISRLKVWLALGVYGLSALLILLFSLNIYAKRWIEPIYDLRLHLQKTSSENMYLPVNIASSGELNQLQQDLVKTLRRLYSEFQDLKDYSYQTEEDLRDAFDEMEMQNILIREARDQAVSSSEAKSAFLANISHELRTPLNSIDGFINLLARNGDLNAEQDLYVQTIRKSSAHLLALVNDVLDFSKIEAGKLVLDKHEFSLYSAIYDVMDMLSPLAAEKGLRMAVMYYNDVPNTIIGDALRIKQVLTNLVGNAIKFTDVGEVIVRISVDEVTSDELVTEPPIKDVTSQLINTPNGDMIHIAVQDTGQGISEKAKAHLFKSFSQGDPSITRQYGGTGLGLVICKQLTKLMGGKIGFYDNDNSDPNSLLAISDNSITNSTVTKNKVRSGMTFWFTIPSYVEVELAEDEFGAHIDSIDDNEQIKLPILRPFAQTRKTENKPLEMLVWINHSTSMKVFQAAVSPLEINITEVRSLAGALDKLKEESNRWEWVIIDGGESDAYEDKVALLKQIRLHYQGKLAVYGYQVSLDTNLLERYKALGLYQPLDKRQLYTMLDTRSTNVTTLVAPPAWHGITVLAVDDHLPNLLVLDALLNELGIKVVTANSGYDAVEIISNQIIASGADKSNGIKSNGIESNVIESNSIDSGSVDLADSADDTNTSHNVYSNDSKSEMSQSENTLLQKDLSSDNESDNPLTSSNNDLQNEHIDLIFMDVQMPRMSGDEAARKIRQLEDDVQKNKNSHYKPIPIIALTAHGLADGKQKLIAAGINDYVGKPISRPQLLQILQRWLGGGSDSAESSFKNTIDPIDTFGSSTLDENSKMKSQIHQNYSDSDEKIADGTKVSTIKDDNEKLIVDWQDALVRSSNKPQLAKQLLYMMQQSVPNELVALKRAWEEQDREQLGQIAHRILGASRYSGVPTIRETSQNFEDKCLLNVQHVTPAQFSMLEPYYLELVSSLEALKELNIERYIDKQISSSDDKDLSENDMTWKMI